MTEAAAGEIDLAFAPQPAALVALLEVDDGAVLFDEARHRLHVLDPLGALVWQCLDGEGTLAEIADDLAEGFDAPIATVRADVLGLVRTLGEAGVLANHAPPEPGVDEFGEQVLHEGAPEEDLPPDDPRLVGPPPSL